MRRVLLHLGTPKTGTTSIQKFCHLNYDIFAAKDSTIYPIAGRKMEQKGANFSHNQLLANLVAQNGSGKASLLNISSEASAYEKIIISSESFFGKLHKRNVQRALKTIRSIFKQDEVKILIYVRRWDLYLESVYNQAVKERIYGIAAKEPITEFINRCEQTIGWHPADYLHYIKVLENIFGKGSVEIRSFDPRALIGGNLYQDFCDAADLQHYEHYKQPLISNVSLSVNQLLAVILLQTFFNQKDKPFLVQTIRDSITSEKTFSDYCLFDQTTRLTIINRFKQDESELRTYIKNPTSFLFDLKDIEDKSLLPQPQFSFEELKALQSILTR